MCCGNGSRSGGVKNVTCAGFFLLLISSVVAMALVRGEEIVF